MNVRILTSLFALACVLLAGCQTANSAASRMSFKEAGGKELGIILPKDTVWRNPDIKVEIKPDGTRLYSLKADEISGSASTVITAAGDANAKIIKQSAELTASLAELAAKAK